MIKTHELIEIEKIKKIANTGGYALIKADSINVTPLQTQGEDITLEEAQQAVNGYVEIIYLTKKLIMLVNEEGRLYGLPNNPLASAIVGSSIVGDVIICNVDKF